MIYDDTNNAFRPVAADADVHSVQVTGNFDDWGKQHPPLTKDEGDNCFKGTVKLDHKQDLIFKFIINEDCWSINHNYSVTADEFGNDNNFVAADDLTMFEEFEQSQEPASLQETTASEKESMSLPHQELDQAGEDIQQVLTSSSSFAAVSLPSDASNFEQVDPMPKPVTGPDLSEQSDTIPRPNLSDSNSTLNNPKGCTTMAASDSTDSNYKIPGAYPVTPNSELSGASNSANPSTPTTSVNSPGASSRKPGTKKDGLVSRFKGFFK